MDTATGFKFIFSTQARILTDPIIPGAIIMTDVGRLYLDRPDGIGRIELTDIKIVNTESELAAIMTPVVGFYYVTATVKLYHYNGADWDCLNQEPEFIGADGKILDEYLSKSVVLLNKDGNIPIKSFPLASSTQSGVVRLGSIEGAARYGKKEDVGLSEVTNDAQVKASDVETTQPSDHSSNTMITSAKQLYELLGGNVSDLSTSEKTLIGAINELYRLIQEK